MQGKYDTGECQKKFHFFIEVYLGISFENIGARLWGTVELVGVNKINHYQR